MLVSPKGDNTRPTQDRTKETLFNVLLPDLCGGEFRLNEVGKLTEVEFGNHYLFVASEHFTGVFRQRVDVAELSHSHVTAFGIEAVDGFVDVAERAAPTDNERVGLRVAVHFEFRNVVGNGINFCLTQQHHLFVVLRVVGDCACSAVFLQAA